MGLSAWPCLGCREHIKDNIVPRAVKWFTGEALAQESDEDEVSRWAPDRHQKLVLCGPAMASCRGRA